MVNGKLIGGGLLLGVVLGLGWWLLRPNPQEQIIANVTPRVTEGSLTIVAFGDSLTAGYGLPMGESYPAQLEKALQAQGKSVRVINAGVSGETTRGNRERAEFIRQQNPDIVLLGIGGNDALRQLSITDAEENIRATIRTLKGGENPPVVILLQMQSPLNAGFAYKREFDAMYERIATEERILLVPFLTAEVFLDNQNKIADGIHLNAQGYGIVVAHYLLPVLLPLLEQLDK